MKYILIPFTMLLWYLTAYYGLYYAVLGIAYMFSLSWFWLIMGGIFLVGLIFGVTNAIPSLLRLLILNIYGINWFSCTIHSLAGTIGIVQVVRFLSANLPQLVIGDESLFILTGMWRTAPFKTVFLVFPFVGLILSLLWSTIVAPIYIKLSGEQI